jgi:hemolysin activation/secretion protein
MAMALEYVASEDALGANRDWQRAEIGLGLALPVFAGDVWWITAAGGSELDGNLPPDRAFTLGGPSSFPGYELGELRVDGYWTVGTGYSWKFRDTLAIRGDALYAGLGLQAGRTYDRVDGLPGEDILGASVFVRGRTIVGPLTVGLGGTTTDAWSLWIAVGRPVGHGTILEHGIFR